MAIESAKAFIERIRTDASFRESIRKARDKKERWELIKETGFNFTKEEFDQAKAELAGQLSEEELEVIAGGSTAFIPVITF